MVCASRGTAADFGGYARVAVRRLARLEYHDVKLQRSPRLLRLGFRLSGCRRRAMPGDGRCLDLRQ